MDFTGSEAYKNVNDPLQISGFLRSAIAVIGVVSQLVAANMFCQLFHVIVTRHNQ